MEKVFNLTPEQLMERCRFEERVDARDAVCMAGRMAGVTDRRIADAIGRSRSAVVVAVKRFKDRLAYNETLQRQFSEFMEALQ